MSREHTPQPGITWETALAWTETLLPEDDGNPFAWHEDPPRPNRATRRAIRRARRRTATKEN